MPFVLLQSQPPANLDYLFAAFAVSWLAFFIYAFFVSRRRKELEREIRELRQVLESREEDDRPGAAPYE